MVRNILELKETDLYAKQLWGFSKIQESSEYVPIYAVTMFILNDLKSPFTILRLDELFASDKTIRVTGKLEKVAFDHAKFLIDESFCWPGGSYDNENEDIKFPEMRSIVFWDLVEKMLIHQPDQCYRYFEINGQPVFKQDWPMWDFCFVLISGNRGIVLVCGAGS